MKAAMNGTLNFSVLDGWWAEGYNGHNGWAIGDDTHYDNLDQQDDADAKSLYDTLENEIVPLYYTKRSAGRLAWGLDPADQGMYSDDLAPILHNPHG